MEIEEKLIKLIDIYETKYPGNAVEKIPPFNKAAEVYRQIRMPGKAISLYEKVLLIQKNINSTDPIELINTLSNLSIVYAVTGNYKKAIDYTKDYTYLLQNYYPGNYASIYSAMNNIASLNLGLEKYGEAEKVYINILSLSTTIQNANPSSIAATNHNLGVLYAKIKKYKKSEYFLSKALQQKKDIFGEKHNEVGMTLSVMSSLYKEMGRISEAEIAEAESVKILGYNPLEK